MDAVQIIYKANTSMDITNNPTGVNLSLRTQDSFVSELSGQVDLAFKFKSISLVSNDLLQIPERTSDANSLQPVLSSYSIESMFDAGVKANGEVQSFNQL